MINASTSKNSRIHNLNTCINRTYIYYLSDSSFNDERMRRISLKLDMYKYQMK